MNIGVPDHTAPAARFTAPLEMLSVCHYGIERRCMSLRQLVSRLGSCGAGATARTAAAELMGYFDTSAKQLHADEEDLFPALIESMPGSDAVCLNALTDVLTADHREIELHWRRVRNALERVVAGDGVSLAAVDVEAFVGSYVRHIEREERDLLPMAARLLSDDALEHIGRTMRERRGIDPIS